MITLLEMAFAGHCGLSIQLPVADTEVLSFAFNEELGFVVQVKQTDSPAFESCFHDVGLQIVYECGTYTKSQSIEISSIELPYKNGSNDFTEKTWSAVSYHMQKLRDNRDCAEQSGTQLDKPSNGISPVVTFDMQQTLDGLYSNKPKVAILREQGVNNTY